MMYWFIFARSVKLVAASITDPKKNGITMVVAEARMRVRKAVKMM